MTHTFEKNGVKRDLKKHASYNVRTNRRIPYDFLYVSRTAMKIMQDFLQESVRQFCQDNPARNSSRKSSNKYCKVVLAKFLYTFQQDFHTNAINIQDILHDPAGFFVRDLKAYY